jgi:hypothetical protein
MVSGGISRPSAKKLNFTPMATVTYEVTAGAAAWIDTDCSAALGTDTSKLYVFVCLGAHSDDLIGARPHGVATDNKANPEYSATLFSKVSSTGHIDFYRNNNGVSDWYFAIGYFS